MCIERKSAVGSRQSVVKARAASHRRLPAQAPRQNFPSARTDCPLAKGFSLIELILFILIVSVGLVVIVKAFEVASLGSADPVLRRQSLAIGQALVEEISFKSFSNPAGGYDDGDPATALAAARSQFDDVMDYNGLLLDGISDMGNAPVPGLENYQVQVAVDAMALASVPASAAYRIAVTVTDPRNEAIRLETYRADY